jgi:hypothetical protein
VVTHSFGEVVGNDGDVREHVDRARASGRAPLDGRLPTYLPLRKADQDAAA